MKANLLDEIFIKHLKGQGKTPSNINFRKDQIYDFLEAKVNKRSNGKWHLAVVILILMICSSGYMNYEQQKRIVGQNNKLQEQSQQILAITNKYDVEKTAYKSLTDSLKYLKSEMLNHTKIVRIEPLPKIIVNQPIVFKNIKESEHITIRYITQYKTPEKEETKLPELDLPVVYESEIMANNSMKRIHSRSLSKRISQLFNK